MQDWLPKGRQTLLSVVGLRKQHKGPPEVDALKGVEFDVEKGTCAALLGPNGAGKSTAIAICTTRMKPSGGSVTIAGINAITHGPQARRVMGVVAQVAQLDNSCTCWENLFYHCRYFGWDKEAAASRTEDLLWDFGLTEKARSFPASLSGGLARRLHIARAIAHNPSFLFLDEPTVGLDPHSRDGVWHLLRRLRADGLTMLLTTHHLQEAEEFASSIIIMNRGVVVQSGTPAQLRRLIDADVQVRLRLRNISESVVSATNRVGGVQSVTEHQSELVVLGNSSEHLLEDLVQATLPAGILDVQVSAPGLDQIFHKLTGATA